MPLEFAKVWRVAQARAEQPVKFGTIAADLASTVLTVKTDVYDDDKRELMWDLAGVLNAELRQLVAAGCTVVQIEEPAIHSAAAWGADEATLDFCVDLFNYTVEGLGEAEIWVHTCWGNPGAQHCFQPTITYEASLEIFLDRINADVWTIDSKHNGHRSLPLSRRTRESSTKKIAVGFVSHRALLVESPEEVAADVRHALEFIDPGAARPDLRLWLRPSGRTEARSRCTRPRRSPRARTSCARSWVRRRQWSEQPNRASRSTCRSLRSRRSAPSTPPGDSDRI